MDNIVGNIGGGVGGTSGGVAGGVVIAGNTVLVGDASYTILPADRRVVLNATLTAGRTWTLPAASSVSSSTQIILMDGVGGLTPYNSNNFLTIARAGSDTIQNPQAPGITTTLSLKTPFSNIVVQSNGSNKWQVMNTDRKGGVWAFGTAANRSLNIPNNVWTPIYFANVNFDTTGTLVIPTATTTIAVASNGAVLPQATINVVDTSAFPTVGFAIVTIAGVDTIFGYTGKTATTFTGCNSGVNAGISVGTLATDQAVSQVLVELPMHSNGLWALIGQACWTGNATGIRGIRFRTLDGTFNLPGATTHVNAIAVDHNMQVCLQPAYNNTPSFANRVEVFQTSGGTLAMKADTAQAPQVMMGQLSDA